MGELVKITRYSKSDYYNMIGRLDEKKNTKITPSQLPLDSLSKLVSKSVVTDTSAPIPSCLTCGVCCNFALVVPVRMDESDRLTEYWDITVDGEEDEIVIDRVLPRNMKTGSCKHLGGKLKKEIACRIYEDRPQVCHDFEVGSDRCHAYRRMYGVEPQLTEKEVSRALKKLKTPKGLITYVMIVVDSYGRRVFYYQNEPDKEHVVKKYWLKIVAFLDDDAETGHELHVFDSEKETWFESDFLGTTLKQARELIESRAVSKD